MLTGALRIVKPRIRFRSIVSGDGRTTQLALGREAAHGGGCAQRTRVSDDSQVDT